MYGVCVCVLHECGTCVWCRIYRCGCAHACGGLRWTSCVFLYTFLFYMFRHCFFLNLEFNIWAGLVSQPFLEFSVFTSHILGLQVGHHEHMLRAHGCWWSEVLGCSAYMAGALCTEPSQGSTIMSTLLYMLIFLSNGCTYRCSIINEFTEGYLLVFLLQHCMTLYLCFCSDLSLFGKWKRLYFLYTLLRVDTCEIVNENPPFFAFLFSCFTYI